MPIEKVVGAIEKLSGVKKGEFESTADFNARKTAAFSEKFLGGLTLEDTFAFVLPVSSADKYFSGFKYSFNADTSEVRLLVLPKPSSMNGIGGPDFQIARRESNGLDQFDVDRKVQSRSTYKASNAYGASVTVEESNYNSFGIAAKKIPFLEITRALFYQDPEPTAQFNLDNAKASKELPALKVLVVMKLSDPYIVYDFMHSKPTRDKPTEFSDQGKYLTGNVLGIVFYSGVTGQIFARLPERFGKPEPKSETQ